MTEPSHGQPEPLDALERQARSHYAAGRYQAAIELFDEVLTRLDVDLDPVHPRVLGIRNDLAREFPATAGAFHVRTWEHRLGPNFL